MNELIFKNTFLKFFKGIYISYIPNKRDNLKQIILKIGFMASFFTLIISAVYIANYFIEADKQDSIIDNSRNIWHSVNETISTDNNADSDELINPEDTVNKILLAENSDFKGWITIKDTKVDNPIYQTNNNDFYLNHNQKKKYSAYGALYFDSKNVIAEEKTDSNLLIYGHEMKNGSMFGNLKKLKSLSFYKEHPTIDFSTLYKSKSVYKIYAIFILNAAKEDDDNYIYNISRKNFINENDFERWCDEAFERSIINTGVDVKMGDNIITLITCSEDFENARLVVMARETREDETPQVDTSRATINPNPRYPKKWYTERGLK